MIPDLPLWPLIKLEFSFSWTHSIGPFGTDLIWIRLVPVEGDLNKSRSSIWRFRCYVLLHFRCCSSSWRAIIGRGADQGYNGLNTSGYSGRKSCPHSEIQCCLHRSPQNWFIRFFWRIVDIYLLWSKTQCHIAVACFCAKTLHFWLW